jgi:hypothetical protein
VREALGGGEGRAAERRTRTRNRQRESQAGQRGEDPPPVVNGGPMAARGPGIRLTAREFDQTEPGGGTRLEIARFEREDCGHVELLSQ